MQPTDVCGVVVSAAEALKQSTPFTPAATIGSGSGVHRGQTGAHCNQGKTRNLKQNTVHTPIMCPIGKLNSATLGQ